MAGQFILCSVTTGATTISTLNSESFDDGVEKILTGAAGNFQADFALAKRVTPRVSFATRKINAVTTYGLGAGSAFFRAVAQGGVGGSTYVSLAGGASNVMTVPISISWSPGLAALACEMIFLSSDGSTAPVTVGSTAGVTTAEDSVWSCDDPLVTRATVSWGYDVAIADDGLLYPKYCFIRGQRPSIEIETQDVALLTQANLCPGNIGTLSVKFAAVASGGVRGSQTTYSVTGLVSGKANGSKPGTISLRCDGTGGITIS